VDARPYMDIFKRLAAQSAEFERSSIGQLRAAVPTWIDQDQTVAG
jgi:hypothetical protein